MPDKTGNRPSARAEPWPRHRAKAGAEDFTMGYAAHGAAHSSTIGPSAIDPAGRECRDG